MQCEKNLKLCVILVFLGTLCLLLKWKICLPPPPWTFPVFTIFFCDKFSPSGSYEYGNEPPHYIKCRNWVMCCADVYVTIWSNHTWIRILLLTAIVNMLQIAFFFSGIIFLKRVVFFFQRCADHTPFHNCSVTCPSQVLSPPGGYYWM